jgi:hypothetical protein
MPLLLIERGFTAPPLASRAAAYHPAEGRSKSSKAEVTDFIALAFFFRIFCQEIACQAPTPSKPHKQNKIELAR